MPNQEAMPLGNRSTITSAVPIDTGTAIASAIADEPRVPTMDASAP